MTNNPIPGALYELLGSGSRRMMETPLFFLCLTDPKIYQFSHGHIFIFLEMGKKDLGRGTRDYILLGPDGRRYFVSLFSPPEDHPIFAETRTWKTETFDYHFRKVAASAG